MRIFSAALLSASLLLSGCHWLGVYTIDLPQGTPITQTMAEKVQIGMTEEQVLQVLGSPALRDTLAPKRWDYIYNDIVGTDGKRSGKKDITGAARYFSVYFNDQQRVSQVQGMDSLPATNLP